MPGRTSLPSVRLSMRWLQGEGIRGGEPGKFDHGHHVVGARTDPRLFNQ